MTDRLTRSTSAVEDPYEFVTRASVVDQTRAKLDVELSRIELVAPADAMTALCTRNSFGVS